MTKYMNRQSTYPILALLISRVSSRAFSQERLSEEELMTLFEAARWAPSAYNNQPCRFLFARRGDKEWESFFDTLVDFNKSWCKNADTLVAVISRNNFTHNNKPSRTAPFDTGAAWMSLALEAHARNIVAHAMEGFNYDALKKNLDIPDSYTIQAMIAIGKKGDKEALPTELKEREVASDRRPLSSIISEGKFSFDS